MKLYEYQRSSSLANLGLSHSDSIFSNFFSSIAARPTKANFHVEPPWDEETKHRSNGLGHITKMASMPIYGKKL